MKLLGERMADLLPCPFCGGTPALQSWTPDDGDDHAHWIECQSCKIEQMALFDTPAEAIAAWNRRAAPEAPSDAAARGAQSLGWILDELRNGEATDHDIARRLVDAEPDIRAALAALRGQTGVK
jgi:Lar family restriction alleviation protein